MSLKNILKNWTLFVSMATGTLLYLLFSQIEALSGAATVLEPVVRELLPVVMFLVLFVTFCKVDFRKMRPVGWHGWIGLVQLLLVAGAVGVIAGLRPTGSRLVLMEAALTCVIAPCASAAPVVTGKLGGDLSAMTTYTFISNFATAFLIPLTFPLVDPSIEMSFFQSFCRIFYRVCTVLLGPMLLAYVVKHYFHRVHRVVLSVRDLSFYLWAIALALATAVTTRSIVHSTVAVAAQLWLVAVSFCCCIMQFWLGRKIGARYEDKITAGQALGQKNTVLAIWIGYTFFTPITAIAGGFYSIWHNVFSSYQLYNQKKTAHR